MVLDRLIQQAISQVLTGIRPVLANLFLHYVFDDFLGYTFRPRHAKNKYGKFVCTLEIWDITQLDDGNRIPNGTYKER